MTNPSMWIKLFCIKPISQLTKTRRPYWLHSNKTYCLQLAHQLKAHPGCCCRLRGGERGMIVKCVLFRCMSPSKNLWSVISWFKKEKNLPFRCHKANKINLRAMFSSSIKRYHFHLASHTTEIEPKNTPTTTTTTSVNDPWETLMKYTIDNCSSSHAHFPDRALMDKWITIAANLK